MRPVELYILSLIVAFCSLVYEFVLAQTLAAVFGGTLLCYALVIGVFTLAMGLGALHIDFLSRSDQGQNKISWSQFVRVEISLTSFGLLGPWWVLAMDPLQWSMVFSGSIFALAFLPCVLIGWYTGKELPLLMELAKNSQRSLRVMVFDYVGMFAASLVFPLLLLPELGVWGTSLLTALLNALVALWVMWRMNSSLWLRATQSIFVLIIVLAWSQLADFDRLATAWFSRV